MNSKKFLLSTAAVFLLAQTQLLAAGGRSGVSTKTEKPAGVTGKSGGDSAADSQRDFEAGRARAGSGTGAATGTAAGATTAPTARTMPPTGGHATTPKINLNGPKAGAGSVAGGVKSGGGRPVDPQDFQNKQELIGKEIGVPVDDRPAKISDSVRKEGEAVDREKFGTAVKSLQQYYSRTNLKQKAEFDYLMGKISTEKLSGVEKEQLETAISLALARFTDANGKIDTEGLENWGKALTDLKADLESGDADVRQNAITFLMGASILYGAKEGGGFNAARKQFHDLKSDKSQADGLSGFIELMSAASRIGAKEIVKQQKAGSVDFGKVESHTLDVLTRWMAFRTSKDPSLKNAELTKTVTFLRCECIGKEATCKR